MKFEEPDHEMPMTSPISDNKSDNRIPMHNGLIFDSRMSINNKDIGLLTDLEICIMPDCPEVTFTRILQMEENYIGIVERLTAEGVIQPNEQFDIKVRLCSEYNIKKEYIFKNCRMWDWRINLSAEYEAKDKMAKETCSFQAEELEII